VAAVLPHAVDAAVLGRADPRRPRHHRAHRGQRHRRGRDQTTRPSIERGETVSAPLAKTNVFPSMVVQMINVGETTGALDAMLSKIADFYEEEVDTAVAGC
jgi:type II secretory pathway component PulF